MEPLQVAGGSKHPISDDTEDSVTQNWLAPQALHGSVVTGPPLSLVVEPPSSEVEFPQLLMASHELALTMHCFVASEKPEQVDSHWGGVAEHVLVIDEHTSAQEVGPVPLPGDADPELPDEQAMAAVRKPTENTRKTPRIRAPYHKIRHVAQLATLVEPDHPLRVPAKVPLRSKKTCVARAGKAARTARKEGYDARGAAAFADWLAQNPAALRKELRDQQANARWANTRTHGVVPERSGPPPALPKSKPSKGRRSSGSKGASTIASGSAPEGDDARHVARATHEGFIEKVAREVQGFYAALLKNVARAKLDAMLVKIKDYFTADDCDVSHPLRGTPLLREAARVARKVREITHMNPERR